MKRYPAKLLLFGEHILLLGAPALATPVPAFSGHWARSQNGRPISASFLDSAGVEAAHLDMESLAADIADGLFFESNIPNGYGLGSSGALCAALYDSYAFDKATGLAELKNIFAGMESFFHGQSSGIDPLTSYLNQPLRIEHKTNVSYFQGVEWMGNAPVVFLLDSQLPRKTGPLVQWFLDNSEETGFREKLEEVLLPAHHTLLRAWTEADEPAFWTALKQVSHFQLDNMPPMIPDTLRPLWSESLDNSDVALKICGGGGGGFTLGFARTKAAARELAGHFKLIFPFETNNTHAPDQN